MRLYYISYCAPMGWQGGVFIEADSVVDAIKRADDEGISASGNEIQSVCFPLDDITEGRPHVPDTMRSRRLGREELLALWPDAEDLMEYEDHVS